MATHTHVSDLCHGLAPEQTKSLEEKAMEPNQTVITGTEDQGNLATPYQPHVQFYEGFNRGNMTAMAANWEQSDEVVMDIRRCLLCSRPRARTYHHR